MELMMAEDDVKGESRFDPFSYYARLEKLKAFVEKNYGGSISTAAAAAAAGLGQTYLCTYFRQKVGISFGTWLRQFRVIKAKKLLGTHDWNISTIALEVGFGSESTMLRAFKEFEGITPSEYRQKLVQRNTSSLTLFDSRQRPDLHSLTG